MTNLLLGQISNTRIVRYPNDELLNIENKVCIMFKKVNREKMMSDKEIYCQRANRWEKNKAEFSGIKHSDSSSTL